MTQTNKDSGANQPYRFICVDKSYLRPRYKKYYVAPFLKFTPKRLTANFITLASNLLMWGVLIISFNIGNLSTGVAAVACASLIHFYALGDYLDGMHARDTGTSSPLGEFLDHHLDVYNSAISVAACFALLNLLTVDNSRLLYVVLWLSYMGFGATMMEEKERGELYFGAIGPFEGVLGVFLFVLSCASASMREFWLTPVVAGYRAYWGVILATGGGFAMTVFGAAKRVGYVPRPFILFGAVSFLLAWLLSSNLVSFAWGWLILACYSGDYIARVMRSHLFHLENPWPDPPGSVGIALLLALDLSGLLESSVMSYAVSALGVYLVLKNLYSIGGTLKMLGKHWLWVNP